MKKRKLNYRFYDPNPAAETADHLLKILIEANAEKVQSAIEKAANALDRDSEKIGEGCSR